MKAEKVYIIRINTELSQKYAIAAATSCAKAEIPFEFFEGYTEKDNLDQVWKKIGLKTKPTIKGKGGAATASHLAVWKRIRDNGECAIILEHDALLLHKPEIDIPDNRMVVLGYKVVDPYNYDHIVAGPPKGIEDRNNHGGAHAYAINHVTASTLLKEIDKHGLRAMIDNAYFLRLGSKNRTKTRLSICSPIAALGWVRESTIWKKAAVDNYKPLLKSFEDNYNSKEKLGLKGPRV